MGEKEIVFLCKGYEGERRPVCRIDEGERELMGLKAVIARYDVSVGVVCEVTSFM